jgi:hypothetical protein
MSNNIFSSKRFALLCKQHVIHHAEFLLLSVVAYIGVIFIVLSIAQVGNSLRPHDLDNFLSFLVGFVAIFGILYAGHAFPAFRSKESTINYLMVPASVLEKFVFEFISRIGIVILMLPLLYWATFHLQGYLFTLFTDGMFRPVGLQHLVKLNMPNPDYPLLIYTLITSAVMLALVLAFTGAAMFNKQPLVKSLFAVAVVVMFFIGYSYIVLEHLGVGTYNPPDTMFLMPFDEIKVLQLVSTALIITIAVMLFVAYRKLKEREV